MFDKRRRENNPCKAAACFPEQGPLLTNQNVASLAFARFRFDAVLAQRSGKSPVASHGPPSLAGFPFDRLPFLNYAVLRTFNNDRSGGRHQKRWQIRASARVRALPGRTSSVAGAAAAREVKRVTFSPGNLRARMLASPCVPSSAERYWKLTPSVRSSFRLFAAVKVCVLLCGARCLFK